MPGFYDRAEATAQRLIYKYGQKAKIRRSVAGASSDPWNPSPGTVSETDVDAIVTEYTQKERESTLIQQNDKKVTISTKGLTFVPTADMEFIDEAGLVYTIITAAPLRPGPKTLMYEMQVRL